MSMTFFTSIQHWNRNIRGKHVESPASGWANKPFSLPNDFSFCFIFQPVLDAAAMDPAKMENFMNGPLLKWVSWVSSVNEGEIDESRLSWSTYSRHAAVKTGSNRMRLRMKTAYTTKICLHELSLSTVSFWSPSSLRTWFCLIPSSHDSHVPSFQLRTLPESPAELRFSDLTSGPFLHNVLQSL